MSNYRARIQVGTVATDSIQSAVTSFNYTHTCEAGSNRVIVAWVHARDATSSGNTVVSSITYGGVAMTAIADDVVGGGGTAALRTSVFTLLNPSVGDNTVSVTLAGAVNAAISHAVLCSNVDLPNYLDDFGAFAQSAVAVGIIGTVTGTDERSMIMSSASAIDPAGTAHNLPSALLRIDNTIGALVSSDTVKAEIGTDLVDSVQALANGGSTKQAIAFVTLRPARRRTHGT